MKKKSVAKRLKYTVDFNPLNAELNPIRHLLALVGARHIVHVSRIRVKTILSTLIFTVFIYDVS